MDINEKLNAFAEYVDGYSDVDDSQPYLYALRGDLKNAVIAGAEWYNKNVWHDMSDPVDETKAHFVVCTNGKVVWTAFSYDLNGATMWAYLDELLPQPDKEKMFNHPLKR